VEALFENLCREKKQKKARDKAIAKAKEKGNPVQATVKEVAKPKEVVKHLKSAHALKHGSLTPHSTSMWIMI